MPRASAAAPQVAPSGGDEPTHNPTPPRSEVGPDAATLALTQRLEQLEDVLRAVLERQPQSPPLAPACATDPGEPAHPAPRAQRRPTAPAPAAHFDLRSDDSDPEDAAATSHLPHEQHRRRSLEEVLRDDRTLPCPHVADNPFPRVPALRHRACHYHPGRAGDSTHADIHAEVQRLHKDQLADLARTELLSLVPALSALYDLQSYLDDAGATLEETPAVVEVDAIRQVMRTASAQLYAARLVVTERLDTIEAATQSRSERAAHARILYGQERSLTGARAPLSDYLANSVQQRTPSGERNRLVEAAAAAASHAERQLQEANSPAVAAFAWFGWLLDGEFETLEPEHA
ncbi:hypothetical protein AB1Y20_009724 [Prymnesium parvum]|uniref:Component of oligomeric Golgi complex 3 n=1 Tax=Prymnesium parvum TaxID=97485 RepID=A0AB34K578_PRYPA